MSEKRYELDVRMDMPKLLIDNNTNEKYNLLMVNDIERIVDLLNEQQNIINILLECLYVAEDTVIHEYSSHIAEDMEKLEKIFKDRDIGEIRKFVLGVDEDESE